jgi:PAS domain S-box-containing protein
MSAMLQKTYGETAECLRRAAEAEARAETANEAKFKADYQLLADAWRKLAQHHECQESLGRFISFNPSTLPLISCADNQPVSSAETADASAAELAPRDDAETILRNTPFLLARCSSDLRYTFVSEAYARMLGHRPEDLVEKKIAEVIGESAFQTILPHINAVLAGQHVEYEAAVNYKNVGPRFVHVTYAPDRDPFDCVRGWIASIVDITERRQTEVALRESDQSIALACVNRRVQ